MDNISKINKAFDDNHSKLHRQADRILELMNKETAVAVEAAYHEFGAYQQAKITEIFNNAVDIFYSSYKPKYYSRQHSLYDVLSLETDEHGMVVAQEPDYFNILDPSQIQPDRNGGSSLFQTVFIEGYHGGAKGISGSKSDVWGEHPDPGVPYYRRPGKVKYHDGTRKWHRYGKWGRRAVRTTAPYTLFADALRAAKSGEIYETFDSIVHKHNDEAMKRVYQQIPRIQEEIYG